MRHSRHASTLFSALAAIGYANRPRPQAEQGCRRIPPMLDPSWDDEDAVYTVPSFSSFLADENGATIIEYSLLATLIAVVAIPIVNTVGGKIVAAFTKVAGAL